MRDVNIHLGQRDAWTVLSSKGDRFYVVVRFPNAVSPLPITENGSYWCACPAIRGRLEAGATEQLRACRHIREVDEPILPESTETREELFARFVDA
jgi:hypothetical protein